MQQIKETMADFTSLVPVWFTKRGRDQCGSMWTGNQFWITRDNTEIYVSITRVLLRIIITVVLANRKNTEWEQLESYFPLRGSLNLLLVNTYRLTFSPSRP